MIILRLKPPFLLAYNSETILCLALSCLTSIFQKLFLIQQKTMGGCASSPKDSDILPADASASPKHAEVETLPREENNNGGEAQEEAPLVDISDPRSEEPVAANQIETTPTEDKAQVDTKEPEQEPVSGNSDAAPPSNADKSDTPLISV